MLAGTKNGNGNGHSRLAHAIENVTDISVDEQPSTIGEVAGNEQFETAEEKGTSFKFVKKQLSYFEVDRVWKLTDQGRNLYVRYYGPDKEGYAAAKVISYTQTGLEIQPINHKALKRVEYEDYVWADKENVRWHGLENWKKIRIDEETDFVIVDRDFRQFYASESWTTRLEAATLYAKGQGSKALKHVQRGGEKLYCNVKALHCISLGEAKALIQHWHALEQDKHVVEANQRVSGSPPKPVVHVPKFELPMVNPSDLIMNVDVRMAFQKFMGASQDVMQAANMYQDAVKTFLEARDEFGRAMNKEMQKLGMPEEFAAIK